jgi:hypothetical protein
MPSPGPHLKGAQDDAVAGEPGNVAADELAVHADGPALDLENPDLLSRYVLEAGVHQVYSMPFLVIDNTTAETIIGVKAWNLLRKAHNAEGPAHMLKHTEVYSQLISKYMVRHFVKPGITGWAQVTGCRGETHELWQMERRVRKDIWYIENWSFLLDLKIIWLTIWDVISGKNDEAY